jgi:hypothetical protein
VLYVLWYSVCGPFAAHGAQGEEEYPLRWLRGTSEVTSVDKRKMDGARARQKLRSIRVWLRYASLIFYLQ